LLKLTLDHTVGSDKRHHLDLSRRSVATDQSPPTPTGSGTVEADLLRSLRIGTISKRDWKTSPIAKKLMILSKLHCTLNVINPIER
jgi:hypothetical protein